MEASYLSLTESEWQEKIKKGRSILSDCRLCHFRCGVDRTEGEAGKCGAAEEVEVSSYSPHFGEEKPLVGRSGSGTIFFSRCNLSCVYCQNYRISQLNEGRSVSRKDLARMMVRLQKRGCININLVSPTHFVPQILEAIHLAEEQGLELPVVYNTGGYDSELTIDLLEGVVDIYMPDAKYGEDSAGKKFSKAIEYWSNLQNILQKMHHQVCDLNLDEQGRARKGLLVRHLVLPNGVAYSGKVVSFIGNRISKATYLNVMDQYRPCYRADQFPEIDRAVTGREYEEVIEKVRNVGLVDH